MRNPLRRNTTPSLPVPGAVIDGPAPLLSERRSIAEAGIPVR